MIDKNELERALRKFLTVNVETTSADSNGNIVIKVSILFEGKVICSQDDLITVPTNE